jgi:hypothetical protein
MPNFEYQLTKAAQHGGVPPYNCRIIPQPERAGSRKISSAALNFWSICHSAPGSGVGKFSFFIT